MASRGKCAWPGGSTDGKSLVQLHANVVDAGEGDLWSADNSCNSYDPNGSSLGFCTNNLGARWVGQRLPRSDATRNIHLVALPISRYWDEGDIFVRILWGLLADSSLTAHTCEIGACAWSDDEDRATFARTWNNTHTLGTEDTSSHIRISSYQALSIENNPVPGDFLQLDLRRDDDDSGEIVVYSVDVSYLANLQ